MTLLSFKQYVVAATGILLVAVSISVARVTPVRGAGSAPVTVVNTPLPVELTGTGAISGTVAVSNFPSTQQVTSSPTTPLNVRDVDNPARHPYSATNRGSFGQSDGEIGIDFDVPAGKRLVVEFVSLSYELPAGQAIVNTHAQYAGNDGQTLLVTFQGNSGGGTALFSTSQLTRFYVEGRLTLFCTRNSGAGDGRVFAGISGYLLDL